MSLPRLRELGLAAVVGILAFIIAIFFLFQLARAAASVTYPSNGGTGTSTTPGYGQLLIGGKSGEYELVASSTFGGGGSSASTTLYSDNGTFSGTNRYGTPAAITLTNATGLPLTSGVTGILPVSNGGTGVNTLTGIAKGNGTGVFTAATNGTDFTLLTAFTCTSGDFVSALTASGGHTCSTPSGGGGASTLATSTADAFGVIPIFTSSSSVPALIGGTTDFSYATSTGRLTIGGTNQSGGDGSIYLANGISPPLGHNLIQGMNDGGIQTFTLPDIGNSATNYFAVSANSIQSGSRVAITDSNGRLTTNSALAFSGSTLTASYASTTALTSATNFLSLGTSDYTLLGTTTSQTSTGAGPKLFAVDTLNNRFPTPPKGVDASIEGAAAAGSSGSGLTGIGIYGYAEDNLTSLDNDTNAVEGFLNTGSGVAANSDAALLASVNGSSASTQYAVEALGGRSYFQNNVGIGTTTPYKLLSIGGDAVIGASTAGGTLGDLYLPKLGAAAGAFLAVDAAGKVIATSTPSGLTGSGATGQATFWSGSSAISGDNSFWWDNTNKRLGIGTTTPQYPLTAFSNSGPQLSLSAGAGVSQWAISNENGNLYIASTTTAGTATTSTAAIEVQNNATTTLRNKNGFDFNSGAHGMRIITGATTTLEFY